MGVWNSDILNGHCALEALCGLGVFLAVPAMALLFLHLLKVLDVHPSVPSLLKKSKGQLVSRSNTVESSPSDVMSTLNVFVRAHQHSAGAAQGWQSLTHTKNMPTRPAKFFRTGLPVSLPLADEAPVAQAILPMSRPLALRHLTPATEAELRWGARDGEECAGNIAPRRMRRLSLTPHVPATGADDYDLSSCLCPVKLRPLRKEGCDSSGHVPPRRIRRGVARTSHTDVLAVVNNDDVDMSGSRCPMRLRPRPRAFVV